MLAFISAAGAGSPDQPHFCGIACRPTPRTRLDRAWAGSTALPVAFTIGLAVHGVRVRLRRPRRRSAVSALKEGGLLETGRQFPGGSWCRDRHRPAGLRCRGPRRVGTNRFSTGHRATTPTGPDDEACAAGRSISRLRPAWRFVPAPETGLPRPEMSSAWMAGHPPASDPPRAATDDYPGAGSGRTCPSRNRADADYFSVMCGRS